MKSPVWRFFLSFFISFCLLNSAIAATSEPNPVTLDVAFAKGEYAFSQKNYAEAEKQFKSVLALSPNNVKAHYWLGAVAFAQGDRQNARASFKQVITIGAPDEWVAKSKAYVDIIDGAGGGTGAKQQAGKSARDKWYAVNVATGMRYDSNLFIDSDAFNTISNQDAFGWEVYLRGAVFPVRKDNLLFGLEYSFYNVLYPEFSGFSTNTHRAGAILAPKWDWVSLLFRPSFSATFVEGGGDLYGMLGQIPITLRLDEGAIGATEISYRFEIEDFSNAGTDDFVITNSFLRDSLGNFWGLDQYFYFMEKKNYFNLGGFIAYEDAHNPFDLWGPEIHGRLGITLPAEILLEAFGAYYAKFYFHDDLPDVGFAPNGIERQDGVLQTGVNLKKEIFGPVWASAGYAYMNNDSNEPVFQYDKHTATIHIGADF